MNYTYKTNNVCATQINFDIDGDIISNISFKGGCNGNLKGIGSLVEGMPAEEVIRRLRGTTCGMKNTSCPDQLAKALEEALNGTL